MMDPNDLVWSVPSSGDPNDITWAAAIEQAEKRTRRERIATAALSGVLASSYREYQGAFGGQPHTVQFASDPKRAANVALKAADALIAELDKPAEETVSP